MRFLRLIAVLALAAALPLDALAAPRVIGDMTAGALLGPLTSTAELQSSFSRNGALIASAGERLGLTRDDFERVRAAVARGNARYVEIPRHLDGMAGERHGVAFAVHDVIIPEHIYGWEVDLNQPHALVRVFIPNSCGNVSYLRVPKRNELALAGYYHFATPAPAAVIAAAPTPLPSERPVAIELAPAAPAAPAHHGASGLLALLALVPLAFIGGGGGITIGGPPHIAPPPHGPPPGPGPIMRGKPPRGLPTPCPPPP